MSAFKIWFPDLHKAIHSDNQEAVRKWIKSMSETSIAIALGYAGEENDVKALESMISNGANVNAKDFWNATSLHRASESNSLDAMELLIAKGAEVNAKDDWERTPLHKR